MRRISPKLKKLALLAAIIAAVCVADVLMREYQQARATLEKLCTYRFANQCDCPAGDGDCYTRCDNLREKSSEACMEELKPSFFKLQDHYTWKFLLLLPAASAMAASMMLVLSWLLRRR